VNSLFNLAWLHLGADEAEAAGDVARQALDLYKINATRLGADETVGAAQLRERRRQVMAVVASLWEIDPVTGMDEAFRAAQWAQSSTAAQVVRRVAARFAAGESDVAELARRKQDLVNRWRVADRQYLALVATSGATSGVTTDLQGSIEAIATEIGTLDEEIGTAFPRLCPFDPARRADDQGHPGTAGPGEALLMPMTTFDETYVFAISRDRAAWAQTALMEQDLDQKVRKLRVDLDPLGAARAAKRLNQPKPVSGPSFDRATAHDLYEKLVAPVADVLEGRETVLVVKEGALAGLPLSVLVASAPQGDDSDPQALRDTDWLARRHAFATLPSANSLQALRQISNPRQAETVLAAFGDPDFAGSEETEQPIQIAGYFNRGVANADALRALPPLPGTRREVLGLAKLLGAPDDAIRLGGQATEAAVKTSPLVSRAAIVTFATHGLVAGDIDGLAEPALAFTAPDTPSTLDDGLLTASEAAELDLAADWVILSACNTAAPDGTPGGEGLSGLASAFLYAGARSLMVSHWPVRDDAAALLTQGAIAARARDASIGHAESLRRSMLALLDDPDLPGGSHPSVWAPFVVVGAD
jgi:CHAT domain-containing protein